MLSLVHSALDLNPKLYDFTQWLNSPEFVSPRKSHYGDQPEGSQAHIQELPALTLQVPLAFANYNDLNGMGCGLKTMDDVSKGAILIKQKTEMGFISGGGLYDRATT